MTEAMSNAARLRQLAHEQSDLVVLHHVTLDGREVTLTAAELHRRVQQVAAELSRRGVATGDRLAIGLRNSPQFTIAAFAAWQLGAVPVPVRWDLPQWELDRVAEVIAPKVYLDDAAVGWIDATADDDVEELPDALSPYSFGICSSGSTGTPKVILRAAPSMFDLSMGTPFMDNWEVVERPQRILVLAPMYHANGFTTLTYLLCGDPLIVLEKFDAALAVDVIERHRITNFTATPTMLQRIADLPGIDDRDLSSIRFILQGAAAMPPSLVHRWAGLIGADRLIMAYGMTEGLGLTAIRGDEWMERQGSVGRGFRGTELRILDDAGDDLPVGEIGEVYLRSLSLAGYQYLGGAPQLRATDDGFHTAGDLGSLDADGFLYLADRRVDLIVTGGANVFPAEVESALIDHPQIADVVVIGLRDEQWGRRVHAIVEAVDHAAPPSADDVIAYAKSRLAAYKVPKTVEFLDIIPRSAATKVSRGALVAERDGS